MAGHDDARRDVRQADRGFGLIDVLAALAAGTVDVDAQIGFVDFDVDIIVDFRDDVDGGERRVATGVGVERGDADKAMDAALGLDVAVGVGTFEAESGLTDARAFAFGDVFDFDLKTTTLGPAGVHAVEQVSPVVGFRATGAGLDGDDGVGAVV